MNPQITDNMPDTDYYAELKKIAKSKDVQINQICNDGDCPRCPIKTQCEDNAN